MTIHLCPYGMPGSVPHGCPAPLLAASAEKAGLKKALNKRHLSSWQQTQIQRRQEPACQSSDSRAQGSPSWHRVPCCNPCQAGSRAHPPLPHLPLGNLFSTSFFPPRGNLASQGWISTQPKHANRASQTSFKKIPVCYNKTQTVKPVQWTKRTSQTTGMPLVCIVSQTKPTTE